MSAVLKKPVGRPKDENLTARRRAEILEAAAGFFAQYGYATADLALLADELGVAKGTLYRYFPSKQDLFLATVDHCMYCLHDEIQAATQGVTEPLERVAVAIRTYFSYFDAHPNVVELFIQERAVFKDRKKPTYFAHREANVGPWRDLFRGLIAEGRLRDVPVETITDVLSNLVYGTMFTNYFAGRRKSLKEQTEELLDIIFNGLTAAPGQTIKTRIDARRLEHGD
ncbi:MAG TPA: TetR/AcrR family transcriptional regulator [Candidatus Obscuribacterales bacterium]